jgi:amino acid adenylation domain-containing protein
VQTYAGATHWFAVPGDLAEKLEQLAQREGATLFMTLLAGFQALLARYSGQDDIVVGSPIAGRTHAEVEPLIGFFVNTLVLRGDLSGDPSFRELLGRTREMALGAYAHQELPFEMLVDEVQPERDLSRTPLFQVMFVLQDAPLPYLTVPGLAFSPVEIDTGTAKFDLTLYLELGGNELRGWLNYNTDLFDAGTIERLQEHWLNLLRCAVDHPEQRLSALELLGEAERHTLLNRFNATATGAPPAAPVHRQFEAQAARTPEAVAVDCEGDRLTYRELNRRANQLARHLRTAGVGPETLVGVCLERSVESIVALLGVLKSGGAYLPLDPAYPAERLAFMLEDSGACVVIAGGDRRPDFGFSILDVGLGALTSADELRTTDYGLPTTDYRLRTVVDLVADWPIIAQEQGDDLEDIATRAHLAYVIYTSGSTGVPKGVMIEHGAFADHCRDVVRFYELAPDDSVLAFAALNFDASLEQIVPTLIAGAKLVLRGPEIWPTADFHRKVAEHGLTVINPPTAYWHQLAQEWATHPELAPAGRLRLVIAGGDAMRPEIVRLWQQTPLADIRLLNAYGPTETTITATTYAVPKLDNAAATLRIPIGQPLPNRSLYILDAKGNPAPIGVPGELYIGGQGVARGYLNRPDLTAERFLDFGSFDFAQDRFWILDFGAAQSKIQNPKSKIYKTGDLARWLPDGTVEFLGRADQQVKIRGFRVELGEIEAALGQHPDVREAIVAAREDRPGEKRLVAYVVMGDGGRGMGNGTPASENSDSTPITYHPSPITQLRAWLNERLPDYMTPAAFVILEALPLTPGGKVDRKALPAPEATPSDHKHGYVSPRTPVEQELAALWADVLKVDRVGIDDNFFELGGHSLLATQLVSRLRTTFQVELPLRRLFETPTIAGLALLLAETQAAQVEADELARLLAEIEGLSDDEAYDILAHEVGG